jgi:hypothetical protein
MKYVKIMSFHELKTNKERILSLFPSSNHHITIGAVVESNGEGKIFVDSTKTPKTAVVWTAPSGEALLYIGGSCDNYGFNEDLVNYFNNTIRCESIKKGFDFYEICPDNNWEPYLQNVLKESMYKEIHSYYLLNPLKFKELQPHWRECIPEGFLLNRIESEDIFEKGQNVPVFSEMDSWISFERFQKYGFGYYLEDNTGKIVSGCMTKAVAVTSCRCEVVVGTDASYWRRGFAALVACATICEALERGLDIIWECSHRNTASIATNQRLGFEHMCDEPLYFGHLHESMEVCFFYGHYCMEELNNLEKAAEWFRKGIAKSAEEKQSIPVEYDFHAARAFAGMGEYDLALQRLYVTLDHLRNPQNFLNRLENEKSFDSLRELEGFKEICRILVRMVKKGT